MTTSVDEIAEHYDVVICGGGVAGLGMARQLQRRRPHTSVLVVDRAAGPAPESAHKVGESSQTGSGYYLGQILGLRDYLTSRHVVKLGVRFFYGGGDLSMQDRLEFGGLIWPAMPSYQVDRGILENDLRAMVADAGATVLTGCDVEDVTLSEDDSPHTVALRHGTRSGTVRGRWVIDTTGRARLIARKLGLTTPIDYPVSACWWRTDQPVCIDEFVDEGNREWHERVDQARWYSTNHLTGDGYWVWLIPLAPGRTSVGIMGLESAHPLRERSNYDSARAWLREHEPRLADALTDRSVLDFKARKNFAYTTRQAFSHHRWACFGDSAVLTDALYSHGGEMIANGAMMTMRLIDLDDRGELTRETAAAYDRGYRKLFDLVHSQYDPAYATFGHPFLASQKLTWDTAMYFAGMLQLIMQNSYDHPEAATIVNDVVDRIGPLNQAMQKLFLEFRDHDPGRLEVDRGMRTWAQPSNELARQALDKLPDDDLPAFFRRQFSRLEEIAAGIFATLARHSDAVSSDALDRLLHAEHGIDPLAVSLRSDRWNADGLFDPSRPAPQFDHPAEFDARKPLDAERSDFRPLHATLRRAAADRRDDCAVVVLPHGRRTTCQELLNRVDRADGSAGSGPCAPVVIDEADPVDALCGMLGALEARRAVLLVDPRWTDEQRVTAERHWESADLPVGAADERRRAAWLETRFTEWGPRHVCWNLVALFRMQNWLNRTLAGDDGRERPRCLWVGPARPELVVPWSLGCPTVVTATVPPGCSVADLLDEHAADVLLTDGDVLRPLAEGDWPGRPVRLVTVGTSPPVDLTRPLRTGAAQFYDFGYLNFAN